MRFDAAVVFVDIAVVAVVVGDTFWHWRNCSCVDVVAAGARRC